MSSFVALMCLIAPPLHDGVHERLGAIQARIVERPFDASLRVEHAGALREHREFARALDELETAARLDDCAPRLDLERGACLLAQGRDAEAELALDRCLDRAPGLASAHRLRALSRERQGRFESALEDREAVVRLSAGRDPEAFLELAEAELARREFGNALRSLDRGIECVGMAPALVLRAIDCEERRGNVDGALARLDAWARTLPRKQLAFVLRAELLERARRGEEARRAWTQALAAIEGRHASRRSTSADRELAGRARDGLARLDPRKGAAPTASATAGSAPGGRP